MASTKKISAAIESIPVKKESLWKAFEDLQPYSAALASFTLQWKNLESHFDSISQSIETRFKEVELKENGKLKENEKGESTVSTLPQKEKTPANKPVKKSPGKTGEFMEATPRPEIKTLCEKMDGKGLRSFINKNRKELAEIRNEIVGALRFASDPAKMVLDAMEGFYSSNLNSKGDKDIELAAIRRSCIRLLECLVLISPEIKNPVKERAKKLAVEWKGKISPGGENPFEVFAFLQLLATFGLVSAFDVDELLDLFVLIARRKQTIDLFKALDLAEKVPEFVQKLASKGMQNQAVKFVYAFELVDKFPPGSLLRAYLKESKKAAQEILKKGNHSAMSQNQAFIREIEAVKAVIKYVAEYKLESEFSSMNLENRISQLRRAALAGKKRISQQKEDKKRAAPTPPIAQPPNKKPRPAATATTYVPPPTAPQRAQPSGPLVDWIPSHSGSAVPYSGPAGPYSGSATYVGAPMGFSVQSSPSKSHLYSSEHPLGSSMYHEPLGYSGYTLSGGLSSYPPYYP